MTYLFLSAAPFDHTGGGQQPTQLALALACQGERILFYQDRPTEGFEDAANFQIWHVDPALRGNFWHPDAELARATLYWERFTANLAEWCDPGIVVVTCPTPWFLEGMRALKAIGWKTAMWLVDDWAAFAKDGQIPWFIPEVQTQAIVEADLVCVTAEPLAEIARRYGREPEIIPNGLSPVFSVPAEPAPIRKGTKTLVYWGGLSGSWFDWGTVFAIAKARPEWVIHLIGDLPRVVESESPGNPTREPWEQVNPPENIIVHGERSQGDLPAIGAACDVGLIPFHQGELTRAVNPIKGYEYLACGLSIVACPMPELAGWPHTIQVELQDHWAPAIEDATAEGRIDASEFLVGKTWHDRALQFKRALGQPSLESLVNG
ncbi:MAG: hypothetical protein KGL39_58585 [Patescibacteria group bacterium]|nr:hypothetical protein [Patescibacteria group bacterium]